MDAHARPIGRLFAAGTVAALSWGAAGCASDSNTADTQLDGPGDTSTPDTSTPDTSTPDTSTADTSTTTSEPEQIADAVTDAEPQDEGSADVSEAEDVSLGTNLNEDEIEGLLWMREEEQLAHDVYLALHEQWDMRIFENITASESTHIAAALAVMDDYGVADPAANNQTGTFTDPQLQELYDQLVERGSTSLIDALEVGAFIEELDIDDLRIRAAATDTPDLIDLYTRLEKGSRNHLRAFTSQLDGRDATYAPTVLDPNAFDKIVSSPMERGHDA